MNVILRRETARNAQSVLEYPCLEVTGYSHIQDAIALTRKYVHCRLFAHATFEWNIPGANT